MAFPLNACLDLISPRPRLRGWPGCSNGYRASWEIQDRAEGRVLCMVALRPRDNELLSHLFPQSEESVPASWFSEVVRGVRGGQRYTGYPARRFWNEEIFLEILAGKVVREWVLDLRAVPDQTSEELRRSLPAFLLKQAPDQAGSGTIHGAERLPGEDLE